jgi:hypothetical protein
MAQKYFLPHMQVLVKCFDLVLVSLCPGGVAWAIYVSFLYFALETSMTNRGHGAPRLLHITWMKTGSPNLEGGLFKRAQFREGTHTAHGNHRSKTDRMHKPLWLDWTGKGIFVQLAHGTVGGQGGL